MTQDLDSFRAETRAWLEANCPPSMRTPMAGEEDAVWGGRNYKFAHPDRKLWLERMGERARRVDDDDLGELRTLGQRRADHGDPSGHVLVELQRARRGRVAVAATRDHRCTAVREVCARGTRRPRRHAHVGMPLQLGERGSTVACASDDREPPVGTVARGERHERHVERRTDVAVERDEWTA